MAITSNAVQNGATVQPSYLSNTYWLKKRFYLFMATACTEVLNWVTARCIDGRPGCESYRFVGKRVWRLTRYFLKRFNSVV